MDWVLFSLSLVVVKIAIICLAIVFDKKFNQGVKLVDSQCYLEAYNLFDRIAKHKYALIFSYCEKILPYQVLCLLNLSRYQESIVICDRIIKKMLEHENNQYKSYIYYFKGGALYELEQFEMALICFNRSVEYQQNNSDFWKLRGCAFLGLNQYRETIKNCNLALKCVIENHDIFGIKAYALYELKDYQQAIANFNHALRYQPDFAPSLYIRSACHAIQNNIDAALEDLQQAIRLDSEINRQEINNNQDFDNLRENKRFQAILNSLC